MSRTFAIEANFIPNRAPYQIVDKVSGQKLVDQINERLHRFYDWHQIRALDMVAKLDPLYVDRRTGEPTSWSVEVVPTSYFEVSWLDDPGEWKGFRKMMKTLFLFLKKECGLVPSVTKRRGNTEIRFGGGGAHCHISSDIFSTSVDFYREMEIFHKNLAVSYTNFPWIRWLFADWNSSIAHHCLWTPYDKLPDCGGPSCQSPEDRVFRKMVEGDVHAIEPRFMESGKSSYLTFEFRIFRMVENVDEMRLIVQFCDRWMDHLRWKVLNNEPVKLELTRVLWDFYTKSAPKAVWKESITPFLEEIGLCAENYRVFFERNYLTRRRYGSMV